MRKILRIRPSKDKKRLGLSQSAYRVFNFLLPIALLLLIWADLNELAIVVALFTKWRVISFNSRHLISNLRFNAVDIIVKLSTLSFIIEAKPTDGSISMVQVAWTLWYIAWLTVVKPGSSRTWVSLQAAIGQTLGLSALLFYSNSLNVAIVVFGAWLIGISAARHFMNGFGDPHEWLLSAVWGVFVAQLTWIMSRWMLVYLFVPQMAFIALIVGYTFAYLYTIRKSEKKTPPLWHSIVVMIVALVILISIGDWHGTV